MNTSVSNQPFILIEPYFSFVNATSALAYFDRNLPDILSYLLMPMCKPVSAQSITPGSTKARFSQFSQRVFLKP